MYYKIEHYIISGLLNYLSGGKYSVNEKIRFKAPMLKSDSDTF